MGQREKIKTGIFLAASAVIFLAGAEGLFFRGPLGEYLRRGETAAMAAELLVFFCWCFFCLRGRGGKWKKAAGLSGAILLFSWCHQVFLPMLVSGIYMAYLLLLGGFFRRLLKLDRAGAGYDFVLGCSVWLTLVCALSAVGAGGIPMLRAAAAVTAVLLFLQAGGRLRNSSGRRRIAEISPLDRECSVREALLVSLLLTMLALQAGRLNVALDYDSLHYGLRSAYVLDNGRGIYENLGNINLVYTYPKGFEALALPLSGTDSYGYVLFFNLWITVGVLGMARAMAGRLSGERGGLLAAAVVSCIPGIMNMGITAKSDSITLLIQMIMLDCFLRLAGGENAGERTKYLAAGVGCYLLSLAMKPTAAVFSTVAWMACAGWLLCGKRLRIRWDRHFAGAAIPALAWLGIWARTWMLTGVPLTSVFTSIWEKLGFRVKEPFAFLSIPDSGASMTAAEGLRYWLGRLWGLLAAPAGEDMAHVVIAWGTGLIPVFALILWLGRPGRDMREESGGPVFGVLGAALAALSVVSMVSLYLLWQVDGNYFMLLYAVLAVLACAAVVRLPGGVFAGSARLVLAVFLTANTAISCVTNWAGTSGFSPASFFHSGYYDHRKAAYLEKSRAGNEAIWNLLAADPSARALAFGEHPWVLDFPCNIQSYYDVTGSGGNVYLVKTLDNFKGFLEYAKIQYLYVQAGYLEPGTRAYDVVRFLIEDGSLGDIRYEYGNMLAEVNLDGGSAASPAASLREFETLYPVKTGE